MSYIAILTIAFMLLMLLIFVLYKDSVQKISYEDAIILNKVNSQMIVNSPFGFMLGSNYIFDYDKNIVE